MDSGAWDGSAAADDHESLSSTNDAELLKRAWRTEKAAPEILQFEAGLVQRSREQIQLVIEKYMFHIHKNTELWNRLSEQEQKFAQRCIEDLEDHFDKSVLSKLPDRYKSSVKQSVISEEDDMVPEPQLDTYVICRTKGSLGALQLDNSGVEDPVDLDPGDLYAVRYKSIKPLVYSGQIELV
ncbi:DNA replication complex GINS protein SLD5 isoform X3 [Rhododendron vialii]|uniref:DNA replication complex GINS protein SLD5 isoform X3 n=1 Tax=Rhododendron vialii TaxID=182163 RepID=UPI00265F88D8|nr:DNA replication complex GINS protein SLD5 isoform X3 [Rhododendron vialii]